MFTGIVESTGTVTARTSSSLRVRPQGRFDRMKLGESIAVDGVCLTVGRIDGEELSFKLLPETLRATTLGSLKAGSRVNLERSLRVGDRVGGHLLLGHVDGKGRVSALKRESGSVTMQISLPAPLAGLLVPKGPVAVDGVSLTLGTNKTKTTVPGTRRVPGTACFEVYLVEHTLSATTLSGKKAGDPVNLELDPVAKYLRAML